MRVVFTKEETEMGNDAKRWMPTMSAKETAIRRAIVSRNAVMTALDAERSKLPLGRRRQEIDASLRRMYHRNARGNRWLLDQGLESEIAVLLPGGCIRNPNRPLPDPAAVKVAERRVLEAWAN